MLNINSIPTGNALVPPSVSPSVGDETESLGAKLLHVLGGGSGAEVVSNTAPRTYRTLGFLVLTSATFSAATADSGYLAAGLTGVAYPAGTTLPFRLSAFTLTSGSVLAIRA